MLGCKTNQVIAECSVVVVAGEQLVPLGTTKMVTLMPCNFLNAQTSRCTMIDKMCEPKVRIHLSCIFFSAHCDVM